MTTYYIDGAVGDDANAGTAEGAGNAWASMSKAFSTVVAGDTVWVKASVTYTDQATFLPVGANNAWIRYEGYTTTPGDGGIVTFDGQSTDAYCWNISGTTGSYAEFVNFKWTGYTGTALAFSTSSDFIAFVNCEWTNNGGAFQFDNNVGCIDCSMNNHSNVSWWDIDNSGRYYGCSFYNNASKMNSASPTFINCIWYNNTKSATSGEFNQAMNVMVNCTLDGEGDATVALANQTTNSIIANCVFHDYQPGVGMPYVIDFSGIPTTWVQGNYMLSNCFSNCGGDYNYELENLTTQYANSRCLGYGDVITSDVSFTDEAGNDYTLAADSPALDAGLTPNLGSG